MGKGETAAHLGVLRSARLAPTLRPPPGLNPECSGPQGRASGQPAPAPGAGCSRRRHQAVRRPHRADRVGTNRRRRIPIRDPSEIPRPQITRGALRHNEADGGCRSTSEDIHLHRRLTVCRLSWKHDRMAHGRVLGGKATTTSPSGAKERAPRELSVSSGLLGAGLPESMRAAPTEIGPHGSRSNSPPNGTHGSR